MEPHGSHCQWTDKESLTAHLSTQNVSGTAGQFAEVVGIDAANVTVLCNYIGGGFGSKFAAGEWGLACAVMARNAGRPVRLILDRATELKIAGTRPSAFCDATIAADKDGNLIAWESHHWGSDGNHGGTIAETNLPYVFSKIKNNRRKVTGIITDTGPYQAWRAPDHPQAAALTMTAVDDLAAKMGIDSLEFVKKNLHLTLRPDVYAGELEAGTGSSTGRPSGTPTAKVPPKGAPSGDSACRFTRGGDRRTGRAATFASIPTAASRRSPGRKTSARARARPSPLSWPKPSESL